MSPRMGEELALALALEGRVEAARGETAQLVALADTLATLPEPQIDATWAAALEARLLTEGPEAPMPVAPPTLTVVPAPQKKQTTTEPVRRAAVVTLPKRRMVVRRSIAAVAAAAALGAFPVVAAASSLPGSPFYGLKIRMERVELALFGGPVADGMKMLEFSDRRINEAQQVETLGGDHDVVTALLAEAQRLADEGSQLVLDNTTDPTELMDLFNAAGDLGDKAGGLLQTLTGDPKREALAAMNLFQDIQDLVDDALGGTAPEVGIPVTAPALTADGGTTAISSDGTSSFESSSGSVAPKDPSDGDGGGGGDKPGDGNGKGLGNVDNPGCEIIGSENGLGDALAFTSKIYCQDSVAVPVQTTVQV